MPWMIWLGITLKRAATDSNCSWNELRLTWVAAKSSCDWCKLQLKWAATKRSCSWNGLRLTRVEADPSWYNLQILQNIKTKFKDLFCKICHFPIRFCISYFKKRQLTLLSTDSSFSCWLHVVTADSSYGWFAFWQLIETCG